MNPEQAFKAVTEEEAPFSFAVILRNWKTQVRYLLGQWKLLCLVGLIGGLAGLGYAFYKPVTYTARLTFVVEDSKSSGGGLASALAGQFGLDLGGLSGGSGVLQGDNVLELLKSQRLLKKALISAYDAPYVVKGKNSLADQYAEAYGWKRKWAGSSKVGKDILFGVNRNSFSRLEDSLLHVIIKNITERELSIAKPDKKLGIFALEITTRDEQLSQLLCQRLLKVTTDFYVDTKTRRVRGNVDRLQKRVDSIGAILNRKTYSAAAANRQLLDGNPAFSAPEVTAEISSRDKLVQSTVFAELTKNLEASKTTLIQETPTVQVVDDPELPLKKNKLSKLLALAAGAVLLTVLTAAFLLYRKI
ncbi:MAG TPA: Wzz/FepE/Etk N-terminal domain-containing protein [Sediminibacterium sp.]|nr:Wzz/FepE/Etk N-terminal domain-containing protein [Sediminibacterium sp.]